MKKLILVLLFAGAPPIAFSGVSTIVKPILKSLISGKSSKNLKKSTIEVRLGQELKNTKRLFDSDNFASLQASRISGDVSNVGKKNHTSIDGIRLTGSGELKVDAKSIRETYRGLGAWDGHSHSMFFDSSQFLVRSTKNNKIILSGDNGKMKLEAEIILSGKSGQGEMIIKHVEIRDGFKSQGQILQLKDFRTSWDDGVGYINGNFVNMRNGMKITDQSIIDNYLRSLFISK